MDNIYSTFEYQNISEISGHTPLHIRLFDSNEPYNQVYGFKFNNQGYFGLNSPFCIPNFIYQHSNLEKIEENFLEFFNACKKNSLEKIHIRFAPNFYQNSLTLTEFTLKKLGANLTNIGLWQSIDCKKLTDVNAYINSLKHSSRKILKKFGANHIHLDNLDLNDFQKIQSAYDLINKNRLNIGTQLKYSQAYLIKLIQTFPKKVKIFNLEIDGVIVAAAICHITQEKILYVAAWGDYGHSLNHSPMYNFALELVNFCIKEGIDYLDFGISSDLNLHTPNLHSFKQNIGCQTYLQNTYQISCY